MNAIVMAIVNPGPSVTSNSGNEQTTVQSGTHLCTSHARVLWVKKTVNTSSIASKTIILSMNVISSIRTWQPNQMMRPSSPQNVVDETHLLRLRQIYKSLSITRSPIYWCLWLLNAKPYIKHLHSLVTGSGIAVLPSMVYYTDLYFPPFKNYPINKLFKRSQERLYPKELARFSFYGLAILVQRSSSSTIYFIFPA